MSPLRRDSPHVGGDGEVLEDDAQGEGGQVVADVLGAERQPGYGCAEPANSAMMSPSVQPAPSGYDTNP
jgi:hypothetical protein